MAGINGRWNRRRFLKWDPAHYSHENRRYFSRRLLQTPTSQRQPLLVILPEAVLMNGFRLPDRSVQDFGPGQKAQNFQSRLKPRFIRGLLSPPQADASKPVGRRSCGGGGSKIHSAWKRISWNAGLGAPQVFLPGRADASQILVAFDCHAAPRHSRNGTRLPTNGLFRQSAASSAITRRWPAGAAPKRLTLIPLSPAGTAGKCPSSGPKWTPSGSVHFPEELTAFNSSAYV